MYCTLYKGSGYSSHIKLSAIIMYCTLYKGSGYSSHTCIHSRQCSLQSWGAVLYSLNTPIFIT